MEMNKKSTIILSVFIGYTIFTFIFYQKLIAFALSSGFLISLLIYIMTNPFYLALTYYIVKSSASKFKAVIGSLLLSLSFTMLSSPRTLEESSLLNLDNIFFRSISKYGLSINLIKLMYYVILPIIFSLLATELLGYTSVLKKIKNGG